MSVCEGEGGVLWWGVGYGLGPMEVFRMLMHGRHKGDRHKPSESWEVRVVQWDDLVEMWVSLL